MCLDKRGVFSKLKSDQDSGIKPFNNLLYLENKIQTSCICTRHSIIRLNYFFNLISYQFPPSQFAPAPTISGACYVLSSFGTFVLALLSVLNMVLPNSLLFVLNLKRLPPQRWFSNRLYLNRTSCVTHYHSIRFFFHST